jgi:hypothetical protein
MTFYVKILRRDRSRKWHVENVAVVAASSEEEAIKKVKGLYPLKRKNTGVRRTFKIGSPVVNMERGCHGTIRDSISPKHNVNPKIFGPY